MTQTESVGDGLALVEGTGVEVSYRLLRGATQKQDQLIAIELQALA